MADDIERIFTTALPGDDTQARGYVPPLFAVGEKAPEPPRPVPPAPTPSPAPSPPSPAPGDEGRGYIPPILPPTPPKPET